MFSLKKKRVVHFLVNVEALGGRKRGRSVKTKARVGTEPAGSGVEGGRRRLTVPKKVGNSKVTAGKGWVSARRCLKVEWKVILFEICKIEC